MVNSLYRPPVKVLPPLDPQRICVRCHHEVFFVCYADRLLTLVCYRCSHPVVLELTRSAARSLAILLDKKGS